MKLQFIFSCYSLNDLEFFFGLNIASGCSLTIYFFVCCKWFPRLEKNCLLDLTHCCRRFNRTIDWLRSIRNNRELLMIALTHLHFVIKTFISVIYFFECWDQCFILLVCSPLFLAQNESRHSVWISPEFLITFFQKSCFSI